RVPGRSGGVRVDVSVDVEEAERRLEAARAAGATVLSDVTEPDCWVLTDPEGNEVMLAMLHGDDS
ncbi:VOC family protein, partial [Phytoactinopolyspora endophytica]|uniref:VOC family protein n=1 Tax=Phytoactinopolyspora endophytica TaxID=1642495 RepID=UPI001F0E4087